MAGFSSLIGTRLATSSWPTPLELLLLQAISRSASIELHMRVGTRVFRRFSRVRGSGPVRVLVSPLFPSGSAQCVRKRTVPT